MRASVPVRRWWHPAQKTACPHSESKLPRHEEVAGELRSSVSYLKSKQSRRSLANGTAHSAHPPTFAFWNQSYPKTATPVHRLFGVMAAACHLGICNFGEADELYDDAQEYLDNLSN